MSDGDPTLIRLQTLAAVAVQHAAQFHGLTLTHEPAMLVALDAILVAEGIHPEQVGTLSTCYGAWFGDLLVRHLGGKWVALHEASAPRIALEHAVVSPMDAVRRRLLAADAPALPELFTRARTWSMPALGRTAMLVQNTRGWDLLAHDPRFTANSVPPDRAAAEDLLDPWLKVEGVTGRRVLCLAAGGGRHGPLFARAGAEVTVLDISPAQLAIDSDLATLHGLRLTTIRGSIDDLTALLPAASFDVAVQPVSASYVRDLAPVHAGLAHLLRPGGLLVTQHKQPAALQASARPHHEGWLIESLYHEGLPLPSVSGHTYREEGTQEFLHTLDVLLGGLCRAGFAIEDVREPQFGDAWAASGSAEQRAAALPPYLKLKARRR